MADCHTCGAPIVASPPIGRSLECPNCRAPIRCCKNCEFYTPGARWDCRETISEAVLDKERANFCDWFRLRTASTGGSGGSAKAQDARNRFDSLFS